MSSGIFSVNAQITYATMAIKKNIISFLSIILTPLKNKLK